MRKTLINACIICGATLTLGTIGVSASTLLDTATYNGHTYQLWDSLDISWDDASVEAMAAGGYLAVFTDQAETETVYAAFLGNGFFTAENDSIHQAWLGGYPIDAAGKRIGSTTDPSGWAWVTAEPWTTYDMGNFESILSIEPNGDSEGLTINRFGKSTWNDEAGRVGGFIVEKDSVPDAGSSLILLGGAVFMMGALRRKS